LWHASYLSAGGGGAMRAAIGWRDRSAGVGGRDFWTQTRSEAKADACGVRCVHEQPSRAGACAAVYTRHSSGFTIRASGSGESSFKRMIGKHWTEAPAYQLTPIMIDSSQRCTLECASMAASCLHSQRLKAGRVVWIRQAWSSREVSDACTESECMLHERLARSSVSKRMQPSHPDEAMFSLPSLSSKSTIIRKIFRHIKISAHAWNTKCRWNQKLIAQFYCTLQDEHFEPN
jgi:hypothetical protein